MLVSKFTADATAQDGLHALASPRVRMGWIALEIVVMTLGVIAIGRWVSPDDPLFTRAPIPWTWFAPILVGLRYGVLAGLSAMAMVLVTWRLLQGADPSVAFPVLYFLGGLLLTMVCGEFSGLWRSRIRRLSQANAYLEDRIEEDQTCQPLISSGQGVIFHSGHRCPLSSQGLEPPQPYPYTLVATLLLL